MHLWVARRLYDRIAIGVQGGGRRAYPPLHLLRSQALAQMGVDPRRPLLTRGVRRATAPRVGDPVHRRFHAHTLSATDQGKHRGPHAADRTRPSNGSALWSHGRTAAFAARVPAPLGLPPLAGAGGGAVLGSPPGGRVARPVRRRPDVREVVRHTGEERSVGVRVLPQQCRLVAAVEALVAEPGR